MFFGRNDAEAETPLLWLPHVKSWLNGKNPDAGRDGGQEEKRTTEDEMAGWHHRLDGLEFEWTPGDCDGQGGLLCCDAWGRKESDMTAQPNWTELNVKILKLWEWMICLWTQSEWVVKLNFRSRLWWPQISFLLETTTLFSLTQTDPKILVNHQKFIIDSKTKMKKDQEFALGVEKVKELHY